MSEVEWLNDLGSSGTSAIAGGAIGLQILSSRTALILSNSYTQLCSRLLFPLHEWAKGHDTLRVRRELECTQWWTRERIRDLQLSRLRNLLIHVGDKVPYYRKIFADLGFDPRKVSSLADLSRLPFLIKDTVRANEASLQAQGAKGLKRISTTGSAGDPLQLSIGASRVTHDVAAKWRATRWWGVDIGDREIVAWSSPIELGAQDRVRQLRDTVIRTRLLPTDSLSPQKIDHILRTIKNYRPRMLFGYSSSIALIAQRAEECGFAMNQLGVKVAFLTAERVYPHQRDTIKRVFNCAVAEGYGGRDSGFIAHECPAGGLHITAEDLAVEIVDPDGRPLPAGQSGEIVVTQFFTHDFPFIRYKTGDIGSLDDRTCPCGRGLPLLKEVNGRTNDFLVTARGEKIHDAAFATVLREVPGIRQFKIVQKSLHDVCLQLVVARNFEPDRHTTRIQNAFRHHLGGDLNLDIDYVPHIEPEPTGKYRYVVNRVSTG